MLYMESSAKNNGNVQSAFETLIQEIYDYFRINPQTSLRPSGAVLDYQNNDTTNKGGCCS